METVSVQIPAKLYTAIYARHEEDTSAVISEHLAQLLQNEKTSESASGSEVQHFMRPGKGTITGRVWEIADELLNENGLAEREAVVTACMNEGIKMNTASTQFSHWKNAVKESGR